MTTPADGIELATIPTPTSTAPTSTDAPDQHSHNQARRR